MECGRADILSARSKGSNDATLREEGSFRR